MDSIRFRSASVEDAAEISALGRRTFHDTFVGKSFYTAELIDDYTSRAFAVDRVAEQISDSSNRFFLLVESTEAMGETNLGYAKLVQRAPEPQVVARVTGPSIYLDKFYIDRPFHHRGLGSVLLQHVRRECTQLGAEWMWLSVWEHNVQAQRFYERNEFLRVGEWDWPWEACGKSYVDCDWLMVGPVQPKRS